MTSYFELLTTHADRIFDPAFEVQRKTLRYDLQYRTVHEVDTILADIECSIYIIFRDIESCYSDDTRLPSDIDMYP